MNWTIVVVAIIGIAGTLLAPWVSGRVQRPLLKAERVLDRQIDAYADLLEVAGHIRQNAQTWSSIPLADLDEPSTDRVRSIDARIRVVGSDDVREATDRFVGLSFEFIRQLVPAQLRHARDRENQGESPEAIADRLALGKVADEIATVVAELESRIRAEMRR